MKNKIHIIGVLVLLLFMLLASNVHEPAAEESNQNKQKARSSLSVILYNWIPNLDEYFNTMKGNSNLFTRRSTCKSFPSPDTTMD